MPRIRTFKPEFFRHEGLQDLEIGHPKSKPMLVFAGLWTQCDCNGTFSWRPRQLKLDILPFIPFEMAETLDVLLAAGFIKKFEADSKVYGQIPTFRKHQRLSGKEAQDGVKYPTLDKGNLVQGSICEAEGKQWGSDGTQPVSQEKERNICRGSVDFSQEVKNLVLYLHESIRKLDPKFHRITKQLENGEWCGEIDKLIRLDERTPEEIRETIEYAHSDPFWQKNILSPRSLRRNFSKLTVARISSTKQDPDQALIDKLGL